MENKLFEFNKKKLQNSDRIFVVGDLHGDYDSFSSLMRQVNPKADLIIFLGDYADRGTKGMEIIRDVSSLLKGYPDKVIALKGNHEDYSVDGNPLFSPCTIIREALTQGVAWEEYFYSDLLPFINKLYLAAIIPGEILFVHAGISSRVKSIESLYNPDRELEIDILWSDTVSGDIPEGPNLIRGIGSIFGEKTVDKCLNALDVKAIIRGHESLKAAKGPGIEFSGKVITINSNRVYGGKPFVYILDPKNLERGEVLFL